MMIEQYTKIPGEHGNAVYPTVEEFCNSHYGDEFIIAHDEEFDYYDEEQEKHFLDKGIEVLFVHGSDLRPCAYLPKNWWMADVLQWRVFDDGIHIMIQEWEGGED